MVDPETHLLGPIMKQCLEGQGPPLGSYTHTLLLADPDPEMVLTPKPGLPEAMEKWAKQFVLNLRASGRED